MRSLAEHFAPISTPLPDARPVYDMVSNAILWSDELPEGDSSEWASIRFVLRHRTCLITGEASEHGDWWAAAQRAFPAWVGFRQERCASSAHLRELYESGVRDAYNSFNKYISNE